LIFEHFVLVLNIYFILSTSAQHTCLFFNNPTSKLIMRFKHGASRINDNLPTFFEFLLTLDFLNVRIYHIETILKISV